MSRLQHTFSALGTTFELCVEDDVAPERFLTDARTCSAMAVRFEAQHSRFRDDSLVALLRRAAGTYEVGEDMVRMLRLYEGLYHATGGAVTPCIGGALEDIGYDRAYSLTPRAHVREVPPLPQVLTINDETHITTMVPLSLDLGALGKGYLVDRLFEHLRSCGYREVLVNGSGDIRYRGARPLRCGLEDPADTGRVLGRLLLADGALCASAQNRRAWRDRTHYVDPHSREKPHTNVSATWVVADTCALADGLATALFFVEPTELSVYSFSHVLLREDRRLSYSPTLALELGATKQGH